MALLGPFRTRLAVLSAAASAVLWAIGLTELQPLTEPADLGENNTYWARELRWGALIALVGSLVTLASDRRRTVGVLAGGVAWLAADIALDRVDFSHTAGLAIGAAVVALLCSAAVLAAPAEPRPAALFSVAMVAAVASGMATAVESPTDQEPALTAGSAATGSLLALVAVAAVARTWRGVAAGALAAAVPWLVRYVSPQPTGGRWLVIYAFTVLLLVAVVALAYPGPRRGLAVVAAIIAVALPVMFLVLALVSAVLQIGRPLTSLAANAPINSADTDVLFMALTIPIGLVLSLGVRSSARTPATTAP